MRKVLAVDLGGTKTAMALVDESGAIGRRVKLAAAHSMAGSIAQIAEMVREEAPSAVGVALPGIFDPKTGLAWAPNLWGADWVPLRDALANRIPLPLAIFNDRSACVLGEQWFGVARDLSDVVFVAVGTGIGVGILSGGRVVEGAHGIAGAAGWMALERNWKPEYGLCGCWEAEAAGPGIARHAAMATSEDVVAAARQGDPHARGALRRTASYLGAGIANLISVLDPELVVLGGGLMQAGDLLLEGIRHEVDRWAQPVTARLVRIELSQLNDDACLLGAARIALQH